MIVRRGRMTVKELENALKRAIESNQYNDDMQVVFLDEDSEREIVRTEYRLDLEATSGVVYLCGVKE